MSNRHTYKTNSTIDFIGIGAPRSGSTWIAKCLRQHPEILFSSQKTNKELNFFNTPHWRKAVKRDASNYQKGIDWYLDQFPPAKPGQIRGEFSVFYLADSKASQRIAKHFPNVKILATLRNPVEMIYSLHHYTQNTVRANIPKKFSEAIKAGFHLKIGKYYQHLQKYYDHFPAQNIHVIIFDDIVKKPRTVTQKLYKFLGVDVKFVPTILDKKVHSAIITRSQALKSLGYQYLAAIHKLGLIKFYNWQLNQSWLYGIYKKLNLSRSPKAPLDHHLKTDLTKCYREDIQKLQQLIGRDLSFWLQPKP